MAETRVIDPEQLGKSKGIHWLTHQKTNLEREGGRDELGRPVNVKVCRMRSEVMCDVHGNEVDIPIETGRVPSRLSFEKYGRAHREAMILEHGFLPRSECPYTQRYGRELAPVPDGDEPCDGLPGGCKHYQRIRKGRAEEAKAKAKERKSAVGALSEAQARQFVASVQALTGAIADGQPTPPRSRAAKPSQDEADKK